MSDIIDLSEDLAYGEMRKCLSHAGEDEINRLREMFEAQAWAQDWQHDTVPPGKPAHELACAAIRALPKLLAAYPLPTPPAKGTPHV